MGTTVQDLALQLAALAFGTSITPGPNNLMLLSSGLRFGVRRTLPHCFGVSLGLALMLAIAYLGLGAIVRSAPGLLTALSIAGAMYLLWLAVATASADPTVALDAPDASQRPMGMVSAIGFQFLNPKVWGMAASGVSLVLSADIAELWRAPLLIGIYSVLNLPCIALWAAAGSGLRARLANPRVRRWFNFGTAALVAATALWMLAPAASLLAPSAQSIAAPLFR